DRRRPGPGCHTAVVGQARQPAERTDAAAAGRGAAVRRPAAGVRWARVRRRGRRPVLGDAGLRPRHHHRPLRRDDRPPHRSGDRVRQAGRPHRRQGAHGHRAGRALDPRAAAVVGHRGDPDPRDRRDRAAVLGHPARRHRGEPRRKAEDRPPGAGDRALHPAVERAPGQRPLVGHGRRPAADRAHRPGLRLPGADAAPHQRAGDAGGRRPAGGRLDGSRRVGRRPHRHRRL
ncbi:MAG: CDP-diacylglycerol--glycerol-3-phosphate 3-phosphatidyltransferase, partial [uncultured Blastococcus sp.]